MRPDPRPGPDPAEQLRRPTPCRRCDGADDELGGRGLLPLVDLEVAREVVVRIREEVLDRGRPEWRGEQRLLGHRGDPVLLLCRGDEGEDGGLLLIGEPGGADGRGHAAIHHVHRGSSRSRDRRPHLPRGSGVSLHRLGESAVHGQRTAIQHSQENHVVCIPRRLRTRLRRRCRGRLRRSRGSPPRAAPRKRPTAPRWTSRCCPSTTSTGTSSPRPAPAAALVTDHTSSTRPETGVRLDGTTLTHGRRRRRVPRHAPRGGAPGPPALVDRRRRRPHRRLAAALGRVPRRADHRGDERARASTSTSVGNHEFDEGYKELQRMADGGCIDDGPDGANNQNSCAGGKPSRARTSTTSRPTSSTRAPTRRSCRPTRSRTSRAPRSASSA